MGVCRSSIYGHYIFKVGRALARWGWCHKAPEWVQEPILWAKMGSVCKFLVTIVALKMAPLEPKEWPAIDYFDKYKGRKLLILDDNALVGLTFEVRTENPKSTTRPRVVAASSASSPSKSTV